MAALALAGSPSQYVSYVSWHGWNNRRQSMELALITATLTKRTLMARDFTEGHNRGRGAPWQKFFAIDHPTVSGRGPVALASLNSTAVGEDSGTLEEQERAFAHLGWRPVPFDRTSCMTDMRGALARVDVPGKPLLYYPSWDGWWPVVVRPQDHAAARAALAKLHLRAEWRTAAALLVAELPPGYRALHFRLGDRAGLSLDCVPGPPRLTRSEGQGLGARHIATVLGWDGCPLSETEDAFDRWEATGPVYIATNRPNDPRAIALQKRTGALLWDHIPLAVRQRALSLVGFAEERDGSAVSLLEQLICAAASDFLPSWPSSWGSFVAEERLKAGKADAGATLAAMRSSMMRMHHASNATHCPAPAAALELPVALRRVPKEKVARRLLRG